VALGIFDVASRWLRVSPWSLLGVVCVAGFLAGGLLDLDHLPAALGIWVRFDLFGAGISSGVHEGRLLHGVAIVGGGIMCACGGGYLFWMVLKDIVNRVR
jgi:hypothetical protein